MPSKTLISFLSREDTPKFDGNIEYKNPRLFKGKVPGYSDYVISDRPDIIEIFEQKGVKDYAKVQSSRKAKPAQSGYEDASGGEPESGSSNEEGGYNEEGQDASQSESDGVLIPEDFWSWNFFQKRAFAQKLTDEKVNSKADVEKVIQQYQ